MSDLKEKTGDSENPGVLVQPKDPLNAVPGFNWEDMKHMESSSSPLVIRTNNTTIYNIPENISRLKKEPYECCFRCFGIGHNFEEVDEKQKRNELHVDEHKQRFLGRNKNYSWEDYLRAMSKKRTEIQECHLEHFTLDFKRLIALVLNCFLILDCMLLFYEDKLTPDIDQICCSSLQDLRMDMLLVQNQVPFFALQLIYSMLMNLSELPDPPLVELCLHFFAKFLDFNENIPLVESEPVHHLLHLVHRHLLPNPSSEPDMSFVESTFSKIFGLFPSQLPHHIRFFSPQHTRQIPISAASRSAFWSLVIEPIPCARRLQDAGIKFRLAPSIGFSNITFNNGVLEIPFLHVDNKTEALLRNLILWEQCHLKAGSYFTSYAIFMDFLINTPEDVEILNRSGIIEQTLGSDEQVVLIFNGLSQNNSYIRDENEFLPQVCKEVNTYRKNIMNVWRSNLKVKYFSNPWSIISFIAASVLVVLTLAQTFFAVLGYFVPP